MTAAVSICRHFCQIVHKKPLAHNLILFQSKADAKAEAKKDCLTNYGGINYVTSI